MALFDEVQFQSDVGGDIAFNSSGGPMRQTQIVVTGSGSEARNARWVNSRRQWDIVFGKFSDNVQWKVIQFFEARNGRLIGFRFKDPMDHKSCLPGTPVSPGVPAFTDQTIAIGDGSTKVFQLIKNYTSGSRTWARNIFKPVTGSVLLGVNGVLQTGGSYSVDYTTGKVTFVSAPPYGDLVTAGYQFDTPVRFDTDKISHNVSDPGAAEINSLPIIELPESELLGA